MSPGEPFCSLSNLSVTSPTSQLILQHFRCFTYVTDRSPTLPLLHLRHSLFSNHFFAFPTSQALHLRHLARCSIHPPHFPSLHLCHNSLSNPSVGLTTSQLILQPFRCLTNVTTYSPTLLAFRTSQALHLRHLASRYAHSPTFLSLHLRHNSFSNPSVALPMSQLIIQPFCRFTYVTTHSPTLPSLYLRHSLFSNPSVASPTSQLFSNHFFRFSYATGSSLKSPGELSCSFSNFPSIHLRHNSFSNPSVALLTLQLVLQLFRRFTYVTADYPTFLSLFLRHRLFTYVTWRAVLLIVQPFRH